MNKLYSPKLIEDLQVADRAAQVASAGEDGGSCNLDHVILRLPFLRRAEGERISNAACVRIDKSYRPGEWYVMVAARGQGNARTRGVEAAKKVLCEAGWDAWVRYVID